MKKILVAFAIVCGISNAAMAQQAQSSQPTAIPAANVNSAVQNTAGASNSGVTNSTVLNTYSSPYSKSDVNSDFHTNQASTAPAVIGSVSGCTYVTGYSGSVVVANFGNSTAGEAPGCMINNLVNFVANGSLKKDANGNWTGPSKVILAAWCKIPLYKEALEDSGEFTCKSSQQAAIAATVLTKPQTQQEPSPLYAGSDPIVRMRHGLPPQ